MAGLTANLRANGSNTTFTKNDNNLLDILQDLLKRITTAPHIYAASHIYIEGIKSIAKTAQPLAKTLLPDVTKLREERIKNLNTQEVPSITTDKESDIAQLTQQVHSLEQLNTELSLSSVEPANRHSAVVKALLRLDPLNQEGSEDIPFQNTLEDWYFYFQEDYQQVPEELKFSENNSADSEETDSANENDIDNDSYTNDSEPEQATDDAQELVVENENTENDKHEFDSENGADDCSKDDIELSFPENETVELNTNDDQNAEIEAQDDNDSDELEEDWEDEWDDEFEDEIEEQEDEEEELENESDANNTSDDEEETLRAEDNSTSTSPEEEEIDTAPAAIKENEETVEQEAEQAQAVTDAPTPSENSAGVTTKIYSSAYSSKASFWKPAMSKINPAAVNAEIDLNNRTHIAAPTA